MNDVSVALCTYQGERFLGKQLQSIAGQSQLPYEVVVCDDGSSDGTLDVVTHFRTAAPFAVRVHVNRERLGVTANFAQAMALCEGSIIALCDQDDVWIPQKLERLTSILRERPGVGAVFSDADLVDGSLRPLGRTMFEATRFSARRRKRFSQGAALEVVLARPVVCGATLAFRSSLRDMLLPIPTTGLHDEWMAALLCATTEVVGLPDALIRYRQHDANQIGAPGSSLLSKLARRRARRVLGNEVGHYQAMVERLSSQPVTPRTTHAIELLEGKVQHLRFRYGLPRRRAVPILREALQGRYHRYSRGFESVGFDLFFREVGRRTAE